MENVERLITSLFPTNIYANDIHNIHYKYSKDTSSECNEQTSFVFWLTRTSTPISKFHWLILLITCQSSYHH